LIGQGGDRTIQTLQQIWASLSPLTHNIWFQFAVLVVTATVHGYVAAWVAVRMLFRPHQPKKLFGLTFWPQGMIPRHRERLAQTIGNAVGNELVSQDTVVHALFETDFFRRKVASFIDSYSTELLSEAYPSLIDILPGPARAPVLDAISQAQLHISEYLARTLKSADTAEIVERFVSRQIDDLLAQRIGELVSPEQEQAALEFLERRFHELSDSPALERKIREFVSERVDDLTESETPLGAMFAPEAVEWIKTRLTQEVPPIVHHLAEIATQSKTRNTIGALIKTEVDEYYQQLSFFKRIFISRDTVHREVDDLVSSTLPRKIEEYLHGEAFAQEAELFLGTTVDNILARPVKSLVGQVAPDKLAVLKEQIATQLIALVHSEDVAASVAGYIADAFAQLRPHTLRAVFEHTSPDSAERLKSAVTKSLLGLLARDQTALIINAMLNEQVEHLLDTPIGKLSDHITEKSLRAAGDALTDRIVAAARERLPAAIAEFDVGGIVRRKISEYPLPKLEALVLSVAAQHLRTIELFGGAMGFVIGIVQGLLFVFWRK
jgi:uncharacterized membrane protein YheB (UPF0754 family)